MNTKKKRIAIAACILGTAFLGASLFLRAQQDPTSEFEYVDGSGQKQKGYYNRDFVKRFPKELEDARAISGFIDHSGNFAFHQLNPVQGQYHFSNGLRYDYSSLTRSDKVLGFQNKKGILVIDFSKLGIHCVEDFSERLTPACTVKDNESKKWGFIDKTGLFVIAPQFQNAHPFSQGFAPVKLEQHWGFINKSGDWLVKPIFDNARAFSDGMAAVSVNGKVGYVNLQGKLIIKPQHDIGFAFSEGLAQVINKIGDPKKAGIGDCEHFIRSFIDKSGKTVFVVNSKLHAGLMNTAFYLSYQKELDYDPNFLKDSPHLNEFNNGVGRFASSDGKFLNDRIVVSDENGFGFLDKTGKIVIPFQYYSAEPFSEGLACVSVAEKIKVDRVRDFMNESRDRLDMSGVVRIEIPKHTFGFIDKNGAFVITPKYLAARNFREGLALVMRSDGTVGFIDKNERMVLEVKSKVDWEEISDFYDGLAGVGPFIHYIPTDSH